MTIIYNINICNCEGFETSGQDGAQFEDALRRLNALEHKLATQVGWDTG